MHVDQLHPRLQAVDIKTGELTPFFFRFLAQLWERTGGPDDFINAIENTQYENYIDGNVVELSEKITDFRYEQALNTEGRIAELENKTEDFHIEQSLTTQGRITELENEIEDLKKALALSPIWVTPQNLADFQLISTAVAYTTTGRQIIVVTSNVTITLNTNPINKELVIIIRATSAGTVTIDGGTKTISDATLTAYDLITNYETVQCLYSYPDDAWLII